jgi:O-antigen ligase
MGWISIAIARSNWAKANPRRLTAAIPVLLAVYVVLEFVFDLSATVADFMGRDSTLHGRTDIWNAVLNAGTNPVLGVGYQSFWMGARLGAVWNSLNVGFGVNEAHNGYLETYLNLGFVGVALLTVFLVSSYRTVCRQFVVSSHFGSFGLALWLVAVFYNFTESAFGASLLWFVLLLSVVVVHRSDEMLPEATEPAVKWRIATGPRSANRYASNEVRSHCVPRILCDSREEELRNTLVESDGFRNLSKRSSNFRSRSATSIGRENRFEVKPSTGR